MLVIVLDKPERDLVDSDFVLGLLKWKNERAYKLAGLYMFAYASLTLDVCLCIFIELLLSHFFLRCTVCL